MSIVNGLLALLGSLEGDVLAVHEERCISVRNRNAECLRCVEACASGALSYRDNQLLAQPERCIGCGTCATACPTCAIEIRNPSDEELTAQVKRSIVATKGHPVIACASGLAEMAALSNGDKVCVVPCLGRIDESLLVGLAAYKALDATLVCGACDECEYAAGGALTCEVVQSARNLLEAFGSTMPLSLTSEVPAWAYEGASAGSRKCKAAAVSSGEGMDRRGFFQSAKDVSAHAAMAALDDSAESAAETTSIAYRKVGKNGTLSHFVPSRRVRLYHYLEHVGKPVCDTVETRAIGSVSIDGDACTSCRMCAVFCPTGALAKLDEGDAFGIVHRPSACMQCRLCERICPNDAIRVSGIVPIKQFLGKQAVCYAMKKPTWTPNRPASMYDKVHQVIGPDLEMCMF